MKKKITKNTVTVFILCFIIQQTHDTVTFPNHISMTVTWITIYFEQLLMKFIFDTQLSVNQL